MESRLGEALPRLFLATCVLATTVALGAILLDYVDDGNGLKLLDRVYLIVTMYVFYTFISCEHARKLNTHC